MLEQDLNNVTLPDNTQHFEIGFMTVALAVKNQRVSAFKLDNSQSNIKIGNNSSQPTMEVTLGNCSLDFLLDFNVLSRPEFIRDKGKGDVMVRGGNASIILKSKNDNGVL